MQASVYNTLITRQQNHKKSIALLIDPDKINLGQTRLLLDIAQKFPPDFWLVGGSLLLKNQFDDAVQFLKKHTHIPILLFPANYTQIHPQADGILFLSLISGRNPEFLIGQHVMSAPLLRHTKLEILPTGYILINCGNQTAVEYISNTKPIPYDKSDLAVGTAIAGEMLGLKLIYLEGGSGAKQPISIKMIQEVRKNLHIPLFVGGGIKTTLQLMQIFEAGADVAVIGTAFEENPVIWQAFYQTVQNCNQ